MQSCCGHNSPKTCCKIPRNPIIGFSRDDPIKAAETVQAITVAPMTGAPAFVCRLIPVYSLKKNCILEQTDKLLTLPRAC